MKVLIKTRIFLFLFAGLINIHVTVCYKHANSKEPQWKYMQILFEMYLCTGNTNWIDRIHTPEMYLTMKHLTEYFCVSSRLERKNTLFNDLVMFYKIIKIRQSDRQCLREAFNIWTYRSVCGSFQFLNKLYFFAFSKSKDSTCRESHDIIPLADKIWCFVRDYLRRSEIQDQFGVIVSHFITCNNGNHMSYRRRRQFDLMSTLHFLRASIEYDGQPKVNDNMDMESVFQFQLYYTGPLYRCVIEYLEHAFDADII